MADNIFPRLLSSRGRGEHEPKGKGKGNMIEALLNINCLPRYPSQTQTED